MVPLAATGRNEVDTECYRTEGRFLRRNRALGFTDGVCRTTTVDGTLGFDWIVPRMTSITVPNATRCSI